MNERRQAILARMERLEQSDAFDRLNAISERAESLPAETQDYFNRIFESASQSGSYETASKAVERLSSIPINAGVKHPEPRMPGDLRFDDPRSARFEYTGQDGKRSRVGLQTVLEQAGVSEDQVKYTKDRFGHPVARIGNYDLKVANGVPMFGARDMDSTNIVNSSIRYSKDGPGGYTGVANNLANVIRKPSTKTFNDMSSDLPSSGFGPGGQTIPISLTETNLAHLAARGMGAVALPRTNERGTALTPEDIQKGLAEAERYRTKNPLEGEPLAHRELAVRKAIEGVMVSTQEVLQRSFPTRSIVDPVTGRVDLETSSVKNNKHLRLTGGSRGYDGGLVDRDGRYRPRMQALAGMEGAEGLHEGNLMRVGMFSKRYAFSEGTGFALDNGLQVSNITRTLVNGVQPNQSPDRAGDAFGNPQWLAEGARLRHGDDIGISTMGLGSYQSASITNIESDERGSVYTVARMNPLHTAEFKEFNSKIQLAPATTEHPLFQSAQRDAGAQPDMVIPLADPGARFAGQAHKLWQHQSASNPEVVSAEDRRKAMLDQFYAEARRMEVPDTSGMVRIMGKDGRVFGAVSQQDGQYVAQGQKSTIPLEEALNRVRDVGGYMDFSHSATDITSNAAMRYVTDNMKDVEVKNQPVPHWQLREVALQKGLEQLQRQHTAEAFAALDETQVRAQAQALGQKWFNNEFSAAEFVPYDKSGGSAGTGSGLFGLDENAGYWLVDYQDKYFDGYVAGNPLANFSKGVTTPSGEQLGVMSTFQPEVYAWMIGRDREGQFSNSARDALRIAKANDSAPALEQRLIEAERRTGKAPVLSSTIDFEAIDAEVRAEKDPSNRLAGLDEQKRQRDNVEKQIRKEVLHRVGQLTDNAPITIEGGNRVHLGGRTAAGYIDPVDRDANSSDKGYGNTLYDALKLDQTVRALTDNPEAQAQQRERLVQKLQENAAAESALATSADVVAASQKIKVPALGGAVSGVQGLPSDMVVVNTADYVNMLKDMNLSAEEMKQQVKRFQDGEAVGLATLYPHANRAAAFYGQRIVSSDFLKKNYEGFEGIVVPDGEALASPEFVASQAKDFDGDRIVVLPTTLDRDQIKFANSIINEGWHNAGGEMQGVVEKSMFGFGDYADKDVRDFKKQSSASLTKQAKEGGESQQRMGVDFNAMVRDVSDASEWSLRKMGDRLNPETLAQMRKSYSRFGQDVYQLSLDMNASADKRTSMLEDILFSGKIAYSDAGVPGTGGGDDFKSLASSYEYGKTKTYRDPNVNQTSSLAQQEAHDSKPYRQQLLSEYSDNVLRAMLGTHQSHRKDKDDSRDLYLGGGLSGVEGRDFKPGVISDHARMLMPLGRADDDQMLGEITELLKDIFENGGLDDADRFKEISQRFLSTVGSASAQDYVIGREDGDISERSMLAVALNAKVGANTVQGYQRAHEIAYQRDYAPDKKLKAKAGAESWTLDRLPGAMSSEARDIGEAMRARQQLSAMVKSGSGFNQGASPLKQFLNAVSSATRSGAEGVFQGFNDLVENSRGVNFAENGGQLEGDGITIVGERGPEVIIGGQVYPNEVYNELFEGTNPDLLKNRHDMRFMANGGDLDNDDSPNIDASLIVPHKSSKQINAGAWNALNSDKRANPGSAAARELYEGVAMGLPWANIPAPQELADKPGNRRTSSDMWMINAQRRERPRAAKPSAEPALPQWDEAPRIPDDVLSEMLASAPPIDEDPFAGMPVFDSPPPDALPAEDLDGNTLGTVPAEATPAPAPTRSRADAKREFAQLNEQRIQWMRAAENMRKTPAARRSSTYAADMADAFQRADLNQQGMDALTKEFGDIFEFDPERGIANQIIEQLPSTSDVRGLNIGRIDGAVIEHNTLSADYTSVNDLIKLQTNLASVKQMNEMIVQDSGLTDNADFMKKFGEAAGQVDYLRGKVSRQRKAGIPEQMIGNSEVIEGFDALVGDFNGSDLQKEQANYIQDIVNSAHQSLLKSTGAQADAFVGKASGSVIAPEQADAIIGATQGISDVTSALSEMMQVSKDASGILGGTIKEQDRYYKQMGAAQGLYKDLSGQLAQLEAKGTRNGEFNRANLGSDEQRAFDALQGDDVKQFMQTMSNNQSQVTQAMSAYQMNRSFREPLSEEQKQIGLLDILKRGGVSGRKARMSDDSKELYEAGLDFDLGALGSYKLRDKGKIDALGGAYRGVDAMQAGLFTASMLRYNLGVPIAGAIDNYQQQQGQRDLALLRSGNVSYEDYMGGEGGTLKRRMAAQEAAEFNIGKQFATTYGGLMGAGSSDFASTAIGAYGSVLAPGVAAGTMLNAVFKANPMVGLVGGALATGAASIGRAMSVGSSADAMSDITYKAREGGFGGALGAVISDLPGSIGYIGAGIARTEEFRTASDMANARIVMEEALAGGYANEVVGSVRRLTGDGLNADNVASSPFSAEATTQSMRIAKDRDMSHLASYAKQEAELGILKDKLGMESKEALDYLSWGAQYGSNLGKTPGSMVDAPELGWIERASALGAGGFDTRKLSETLAASRGVDTWNAEQFGQIYQEAEKLGVDSQASGKNIALESARLLGLSQESTSTNRARAFAGLSGVDIATMPYQDNQFGRQAYLNALSTTASVEMSNTTLGATYTGFESRQRQLIDDGQLARAGIEQSQYSGAMSMIGRWQAYNPTLNTAAAEYSMAQLSQRSQTEFGLVSNMLSGDVRAASVAQRKYGLGQQFNFMDEAGRQAYQQDIDPAEASYIQNTDAVKRLGWLEQGEMATTRYGQGIRAYQAEIRDLQTEQGQRQYQYSRDMSTMQMGMTMGDVSALTDFTTGLKDATDGLDEVSKVFEKFGYQFDQGDGRGNWQVEDDQRALRREQQQYSVTQGDKNIDLALREFDLAGKQFYEKIALGKEQQEYGYSYNKNEMSIGRSQQLRQQEWGMQDWSFNRSRSEISFGWQQEDFDRSIRYARGRERVDLMRQKNRSVIDQSMNVAKQDVDLGRMKETNQWAEQRFEREKAHFEQTFEFQQREMEMTIKHFEEDRVLQLERLMMQQEAHEKQKQWMEEEWANEDQLILLQRQGQELSMKTQIEMNDQAFETSETVRILGENITAASLAAEDQKAMFDQLVATGDLLPQIADQVGISMDGIVTSFGASSQALLALAIQNFEAMIAPFTGGAAVPMTPPAMGPELPPAALPPATGPSFEGMPTGLPPAAPVLPSFGGASLSPSVSASVGSSDSETELLKRIAGALERIEAMGPGRVNATIYTNKSEVSTDSLLNDVYSRS
jgi:hypothetical protein